MRTFFIVASLVLLSLGQLETQDVSFAVGDEISFKLPAPAAEEGGSTTMEWIYLDHENGVIKENFKFTGKEI